MQSMLERVGTSVLDHLDKPLSTMDLGERGLLALAIARAAIEAMREPTEEMIKRAQLVDPLGYCDVPDDEVNEIYGTIWGGMVDAALAQG